MIYEYNIPANTIWTSFDYGTVEADSYEEARYKALARLDYDFDVANRTLALIGTGMKIIFDRTQVEIKLK